jgi:hypothetical protein
MYCSPGRPLHAATIKKNTTCAFAKVQVDVALILFLRKLSFLLGQKNKEPAWAPLLNTHYLILKSITDCGFKRLIIFPVTDRLLIFVHKLQ